MNKVILMGRLTKDPELRYTQSADPLAVAKYTLAVNRKYKRTGEPDADFINCVAFGKSAEFAEKYFKKGQLVAVVGRLQVRSYDNNGQKQWFTEVVLEEQNFAESKSASSNSNKTYTKTNQNITRSDVNNTEDFFSIDESVDDEDLPF